MVTREAGRNCPSLHEHAVFGFKAKNRALIPGEVPEGVFNVLIELSAIHSEKIINALRDHLVSGETRKTSCERHGASVSYFSVALGRLFRVSQLVSQLAPYY